MTNLFKPMLAATLESAIPSSAFPLYVSPKLDGIRATIQNGVVLTRKQLPMVNDFTQQMFGRPELNGLDGELIVGDATHKDVFKRSGAVCTKGGKPPAVLYVFDLHHPALRFQERLEAAKKVVDQFSEQLPIVLVPHIIVRNQQELDAVEQELVDKGYEGAMIRTLRGPYKQGRSTERELYLAKIKRFTDAEGLVLDMLEGSHNTNVATTDALGHSKRSSAKAGKIPNGTLGSFVVKNLETGVVHRVSPSGTMAEVQAMWNDRENLIGKVLKFKYQAVGTDVKPRFSQFLAWRDSSDVGDPEDVS